VTDAFQLGITSAQRTPRLLIVSSVRRTLLPQVVWLAHLPSSAFGAEFVTELTDLEVGGRSSARPRNPDAPKADAGGADQA
jgi:hypothetical protein